MSLPFPVPFTPPVTVGFHTLRFLYGFGRTPQPADNKFSIKDQLKCRLIRFILKTVYYFLLPSWAWQHVSLTQKGTPLTRLCYLFKKSLNAQIRALFRF